MVMKEELKDAKTPSPKDHSEIDQSLGYVTASEIRNAWIEWMRKLDVTVWPASGRTPARSEVLELFESLQYRLLTRASQRIPAPRPQMPTKKAPKDQPETSRADYDARQARLSRYHQNT